MSLIKAKTSMFLRQYNNALKYFKSYMYENPCVPFNKDELNLISEAYNNLLDVKRNCISELKAYIETLENSTKEYILALFAMLDEEQNDFIAICTEIIDIINNNLLQNVEEVREKVFIYKMKGDYSRYKWEVNGDHVTCIEATQAYYEAISMCQWNFEPIDTYLLEVVKMYTIHLRNTNNINTAILILKKTIDDAQTQMENNNDLINRSRIELLLTDLNDYLKNVQVIAELQQQIEQFRLVEELNVGEHAIGINEFDDQLSINLRRCG